jgi:hypothetical protein
MSIFRGRRRAEATEEAPEGYAGADRLEGRRASDRSLAGPQGAAHRDVRQEGSSRRSLWRPRQVGAAAVGTVGWGVLAIARLVMAVATLIALLIALAIVLRDVDANSRNTIVKGIHEGANFFAGAFTGLITFKGHAKREITVDWGIALLVYLIVGALLARAIARVGRSGLSYGRARRLAS